ncbi:MAG TPA: hypothetical protein VLJ16_10140 [Acidobacteriota bacterium]|nr:hypothetical protein [Acidobacteriota bacterium]
MAPPSQGRIYQKEEILDIRRHKAISVLMQGILGRQKQGGPVNYGSGGKAKFFSAGLAFALALMLIGPGALAKERAGARIKVTKVDGTTLEGELIAVNGLDLVILETSKGIEATESLTEIKKIRIGNTSAKVLGAFGLGAASAAICAYAVPPNGEVGPTGERTVPSRTSQAIWGGIAGIAAGLLYVSERQHINVKAAEPDGLVRIAARLRKRARNRG